MRAQRRKAQCCSLGASLVIAACRSEPFGVCAARRGPRVQLLKERCALFRPVVPSGADAAPEGARPLRCYELLHVGLLHSLVAQRRARAHRCTPHAARPPAGGDRVPCGARCLAAELRAWHGLDEGPIGWWAAQGKARPALCLCARRQIRIFEQLVGAKLSIMSWAPAYQEAFPEAMRLSRLGKEALKHAVALMSQQQWQYSSASAIA